MWLTVIIFSDWLIIIFQNNVWDLYLCVYIFYLDWGRVDCPWWVHKVCQPDLQTCLVSSLHSTVSVTCFNDCDLMFCLTAWLQHFKAHPQNDKWQMRWVDKYASRMITTIINVSIFTLAQRKGETNPVSEQRCPKFVELRTDQAEIPEDQLLHHVGYWKTVLQWFYFQCLASS